MKVEERKSYLKIRGLTEVGLKKLMARVIAASENSSKSRIRVDCCIQR